MRLSVQMETIDEQIQKMPPDRNNLQQLVLVKEDLTKQKVALEQTIQDFNGLDSSEQRRLIELSEAVEAVDEAIKYKNDLIKKNQMNLENMEDENYRKVEYLINNMGDLNLDEYKHLLGKLFIKIIDLRRDIMEIENTKHHLEMKTDSQFKTIHELERTIKLIETRYENLIIDQNCKHENDVHFFMEQLNNMEIDSRTKECNL